MRCSSPMGFHDNEPLEPARPKGHGSRFRHLGFRITKLGSLPVEAHGNLLLAHRKAEKGERGSLRLKGDLWKAYPFSQRVSLEGVTFLGKGNHLPYGSDKLPELEGIGSDKLPLSPFAVALKLDPTRSGSLRSLKGIS